MFKHLAVNPSLSKGRLYGENEEDQFRTPFERDRGRVIHSSSFNDKITLCWLTIAFFNMSFL